MAEAGPREQRPTPYRKPGGPGGGPGGMRRPGGSRFGKPGGKRFTKRPNRVLEKIDFKEPGLLSNFITEQGKILPGRTTRLHPKDQRKLTKAIKRARYMALLPFTKKQ